MEDATNYSENLDKPLAEHKFLLRVSFEELLSLREAIKYVHPPVSDGKLKLVNDMNIRLQVIQYYAWESSSKIKPLDNPEETFF